MSGRRPPSRFERFAAPLVAVAFGVSRPLLDLLGRNAEFFLAHSAPTIDIVALGLALGVGLPAAAGGLALLPGRAGRLLGRLGVWLGAAGLAVQTLARLPFVEQVGWGMTAAAAAAGLGFVLLLERRAGIRQAVRYLSPTPVLFTGLFLLSSPTASLVVAAADFTLPAGVEVGSPAPVVVIVFDEFPVASLIDPAGGLRADRYPAFARLAADGTWFRNALTVRQQTEDSVPTILTGLTPEGDLVPSAGSHPFSLFTLLADRYEITSFETITALCPEYACTNHARRAAPTAQRWTTLTADVAAIAGHMLLPQPIAEDLPATDRSWGFFGAAATGEEGGFDAIDRFRAALEADPRRPIDDFIRSIRPAGDEPPLLFLHAVVPHHPWQFLPSGQRYLLQREKAPGSTRFGWGADEWLVDQALQRHLLQVGYADRVLGRILERLQATGLYDDALVVVTADHGIAVRPGVDHQRRITPDTVGEIAAVPLFVKRPQDDGGVIDDYRATTADILPTIADVLDVALPWEADGVSLFAADRPDRPSTEVVGPEGSVRVGPEGTEKLAVAARLAEAFPTGDPYELTPAGAPDLVGTVVADAERAEEAVARLDRPGWFQEVDPAADAVPALVEGWMPRTGGDDRILAVAIDGVVVAVTRTYPAENVDRFAAMVPVEAFSPGDARIDLLLVEGSGEARRLIRIGGT